MADPSETTLASPASGEVAPSELLDAVRSLSEQVGGLQTELQGLQAERHVLPPGDVGAPGWDTSAPARRDGSPWLRSIASPAPRAPAVPRLFLEIAFLVAVACLLAVARLETALVIGIMAAAWVLVALAEWAADRATRQRTEAAFGRYGAQDGPWFGAPPRDARPELAGGPASGEGDSAAKLPPPPTAGEATP
jgi:hypothetical protein